VHDPFLDLGTLGTRTEDFSYLLGGRGGKTGKGLDPCPVEVVSPSPSGTNTINHIALFGVTLAYSRHRELNAQIVAKLLAEHQHFTVR
jgi:hypothetical protein